MKNTRKYKKKHMKKKGGSFPDKKVSIRLLEQYNLPRDLTKKITRHLAALTIDDTRKKYLNKRAIKRYFKNLCEGCYNPTNLEFSEMISKAANILKKDDDDIFWRKILAKLYNSLYDNAQAIQEIYAEYKYGKARGLSKQDKINLLRTETAFLKLSKKFSIVLDPFYYLEDAKTYDLFDSIINS